VGSGYRPLNWKISSIYPAVSEVAVIGTIDEKWGEKPLALIVLKEDTAEPDTKEIVKHVKAFIEKGLMDELALLVSARYVKAIDKTSVEKIDKKLLREKYAD